jgi:hypothetical protein
MVKRYYSRKRRGSLHNFYAVKNGLVGNDSTGVPAAFGRLERVLYPSYWETGLNQKSGEIELNILE